MQMEKEKNVHAVGAMAARMSLLLVLCVAVHMPLSVAEPYTNMVSYSCGNHSEYRNGSAFQHNLNKVMKRLVKSAYYSAYNTSRFGDEGFNSAVYGLVQCLAILEHHECHRCASTAKTRLVQTCNGTSGDIQLNGCRLGYDENPVEFASVVWSQCQNNKYRNGRAFQQNLNKLLESLVGGAHVREFRGSGVEGKDNNTVRGVVQCQGDLEPTACKQCALTAKAKLLEGCHRTSGFIQLGGCNLSYNYNDISSILAESPVQEYTTGLPGPSRGESPVQEYTPPPSPGRSLVQEYTLYTLAVHPPPSAPAPSPRPPPSAPTPSPGRGSPAPPPSPGTFFHIVYDDKEYITISPHPPPPPLQRRKSSRPPSAPVPSPRPPPLPPAPAPPPSPGGQSPSSRKKGPSASKGKVLKITLGAIAAVIVLIAIIGTGHRMCHFSSGQISGKKEGILAGTEINPELIFKYNILREATSNFKLENRLGEGTFGCVYRGVLPDRREVAVKRLKQNSGQRNSSKLDAEFLNEANLISRAQHKNVVKLLGCSVNSSERLLVYEYFPLGSLHNLLFGTRKRHLLDWKERCKIIVGIAQGLQYLHEECSQGIVHRDIKASNILLDNKHRPKIADFGLAKLFAEDQSSLNTRAAGTIGYMAPEYALCGQLTNKADVYSFGVLLLEIISGRKNSDDIEPLIQRTWRLYQAQRALEVMDPTLEGSYSWEEGIRVIKIGLLCTQVEAALRPSMSEVVWMLTNDGDLPSPKRPGFIDWGEPNLPRPDVHSAAADPSSSILEGR